MRVLHDESIGKKILERTVEYDTSGKTPVAVLYRFVATVHQRNLKYTLML